MKLQELANRIEQRFNTNELHDLCFKLNIDYDNLPGSTRKDKVRELVKFCNRHGKLDELISLCKALRPNETWNFEGQNLKKRSMKQSNNNPLSIKTILSGVIITVISGVILAYLIQDARFDPARESNQTTNNNEGLTQATNVLPAPTSSIPLEPTVTITPISTVPMNLSPVPASPMPTDIPLPTDEPTRTSETYSIEITEGLVAYFPFNGSINDLSGNQIVGTAYGGNFSIDRFGNENKAYSFDGNGTYIRYSDTLNDINIPFTISTWVWMEKPYWFFTSDDNIVDSGNYAGFWFGLPGGKLDIGYGDGTGDRSGNRRSKTSFLEIPPQKWTHIAAVVRDPQDISLFIDGVEVDGEYSGSGMGDMIHNSWTVMIGGKTKHASLAEGSAYFGGMIDDLFIYNRELTPQEIFTLYIGNEN